MIAIVVSAGAAGCVVASRLAERNASVLLLEAGGAQDAVYTDIPALFMRIGNKRPDLQWELRMEQQKYAAKAYPDGRGSQPSGKALGGATTHNNMYFNRGNPRDYDLWEHKYGAKGWSFKDVLPFFKKFENNKDREILVKNSGYHGTEGPVQINTPKDPGENLLILKSVFNSMGINDTDVNGPQQLGTMIGQSFIATNGLRSSSSNAYIDPNPYPNNLHIVTKALVTKILFNGLIAVGVEFAKNDKPFRVMAKKEVIISAGTIKTPQLLMLSGIGPKNHLMNYKIPVVLDLPVGMNYKVHIGFNNTVLLGPPLSIDNLEQLYYEKSGPLSQFPFLITYFSDRSNANPQWPNIIMWSFLGNDGSIMHNPALMLLRSRGRVSLQSTSPYIHPKIDPNIYSDPRDFADAIDVMTFALCIEDHPLVARNTVFPSIASLGCPSCPGLKDYQCIEGIKCFLVKATNTLSHVSGTSRMGAVDRNDVVVDPQLKVKHMKNLRVCDTSIMPDNPNGNSYAPALMIGERCAQFIKDCYHL